MRGHTLTVCLLLFACNRDRESLGEFDEARSMAIVPCGTPQHFHDPTEDGIPEFRCTLGALEGCIGNPPPCPGCPCDGSLTLRRARNGTEADLLQIQVDHCPHELAVHTIAGPGFDWFIAESEKAEPSSARAAKWKLDLDEPAHGASTGSSPAKIGTVTALRIYGDRVMEINWSRDAFRQNDGSIELQSTESYLIAIRARHKGDVERVTVREEPRVTGVPVCK